MQAGRSLDSYDLARVERAASLAVFSRDIRSAVAILRKCTAALALALTRPASLQLRGAAGGGGTLSRVAAAQRQIANAAVASPAPLLNLVAMSLAGFPASGVAPSGGGAADVGEAHAMRELWKEMCRALLPQLQEHHPYLCAACAFLCNSTYVPRGGAGCAAAARDRDRSLSLVRLRRRLHPSSPLPPYRTNSISSDALAVLGR